MCQRKCIQLWNVITLCVENLTLPKEPVPKVTPTSKSLKVSGDGRTRTELALLGDEEEDIIYNSTL